MASVCTLVGARAFSFERSTFFSFISINWILSDTYILFDDCIHRVRARVAQGYLMTVIISEKKLIKTFQMRHEARKNLYHWGQSSVTCFSLVEMAFFAKMTFVLDFYFAPLPEIGLIRFLSTNLT